MIEYWMVLDGTVPLSKILSSEVVEIVPQSDGTTARFRQLLGVYRDCLVPAVAAVTLYRPITGQPFLLA